VIHSLEALYSLHLNRLVGYPMFRTVLRLTLPLDRHYFRPAVGPIRPMAPDSVAATHWLVAESGSFRLTQVVASLMFRAAQGLSAVSRSRPDRAYSVLSPAAGSTSSTAGYCRSAKVLATQQIHLNLRTLVTRLVCLV
jgi:hypothetical protein